MRTCNWCLEVFQDDEKVYLIIPRQDRSGQNPQTYHLECHKKAYKRELLTKIILHIVALVLVTTLVAVWILVKFIR
ncbi:hypothetical protein SCLARK_00736 [Spiroplasma clarkii]|uniref:Uncharacterized protein n=1 Tax=Spiroplasma clarkii TaxID=2139 RepID=A0A1Y0L080_9MOLU|nr:hypothetical protein [Spiroplasma clarkii]ARU91383.1 hypothetical protein SCLARK_00736 [Spiroplasma clarkii]ATX70799.1 hypothetical protein SCLAR_v1c04780 [Spiroplasma clarkii]